METCVLIPQELSLAITPSERERGKHGKDVNVSVFSNVRISQGTFLYPFQGTIRLDKIELGSYLDENDIRHRYGCYDEISNTKGRHCNWVRFLRASPTYSEEVNVIGTRVKGEPIFEVVKNIPANTELIAFFLPERPEEVFFMPAVNYLRNSLYRRTMDTILEDSPLDLSTSLLSRVMIPSPGSTSSSPPSLGGDADERKSPITSSETSSTAGDILENLKHTTHSQALNEALNLRHTSDVFNELEWKSRADFHSRAQIFGGGEVLIGRQTKTRSQRGERNLLPCEVCGKAFDRPSLLKRHMRTHTGEKPHVCLVCNKGFSTSSSLNTHRRIHSGEKPHQCQVCGKRFTASSNLYYHRMTHIKEKPHKCTLCAKSFPTPGDLKSHMYVHNGSWPFKCHICNRGFSKHTNLKNHLFLHTDKLKWEVGQWGPCSETETRMNLTLSGVPNSDFERTKENYGLMQRNVSCLLVSHDDIKLHLAVDEENCLTIARKPDPARLCHIPKAQDCVVTEFTKWSVCKGCHSNSNQTRIRHVLVAPKNGGRPCPELSETRRCPQKTECAGRSHGRPKKDFWLKISSWSKCEVPNAPSSGEEGEYRFGSQIDGNAALSMMDVSLSAESSEKQTIFYAQVGYQTREIVCKDSSGATVDLSSCRVTLEDLPIRLRSCIVPYDCVVTEWSPWTKTEDGCVEAGGIIRAEVHERKRQVMRLPEGNGQPCPHLHEKKEFSNREYLPLCRHKYKRILSKWSDCIITSGRESVKVGCGGGIQLRTISCVAISTGQPVEDIHCALLDDPEELPTVQRCEVACPRDCVVGEWSKWGLCLRDSCSGNVTSAASGYRTRERNIAVQPSTKGLACPAVTEVQPCTDVHCHRWFVGHWGSCVLKSSGKCGAGLRKRSVKCVDLAKKTVDDSLCFYKHKPQEEEPCSVPCPFDCVLSAWSEWSPCSHSCSGEKMVALRQRNRTIIAPPGPGGHKCPNPDELTEMEPCNTHSCHGYSWLVLPWQSCTSEDEKFDSGNIPSAAEIMENPDLLNILAGDNASNTVRIEEEEDGRKTCGTGIRTREVWCVEDNNIRVADSRCNPVEKPLTRETCIKECPVNCQLSPWAEWSVCPQECVPDASNEVRDGEVAPTQSRSRVVLKNPTNGGTACQHLDEFRPCPLSAARCKHYKWQLSEWSECQLPASLKCGEGYRTRGVWCSKNQRAAKVSPTYCMENDGPPPVLSEKCTVDCSRHCVLTEWSPWTKCTSSCRGEISRTRQLIGISASRTVCVNTDLYPLRESQECPCQDFRIMSDEYWSTCILDHPIEKVVANGRTAHDACGSGVRYKRNICMNPAGEIVEPSFCEMENSLAEEPCIEPCPVDCVQSEWSAWGECSSFCGPGQQNRTREVIQEAREGGRPCGTNFEVKVCNTPCSKYRWASSGYTQCALKSQDEFRGCGVGDQSRTVRCLDYSRSGTAIQIRDEYCDPVKKPEAFSQCHVSCPGDCVVSPWSEWSECDESCSSTKERERTRVLLRGPGQETPKAKECPNLIEVQNCRINVTCFTYEWKITPYGSCLPLGGSPCGEGVQTRAIYCQRSDGRFVSDDLCPPKGKPSAAEKWCYLECPIDCELSPWSKWNSSECSCGRTNGFEYRRRHISNSPSGSGRPCPSNLEQRRPCPVEPCYTWIRGLWSSCVLEGAACGHGISYRNISCLRGTVTVDTSLCFERKSLNPKLSEIELISLDLNTETSCYVPCQGDCEVSEWSHWSHCHRNCQDNPTGGYQTRSRAILKKSLRDGESCPKILWETKPCNAGPCLTFDWYIKGESVVCRRSDGIFVTGGCDERRKPCLANCSLVKHSRCLAGSCTCLDGYQPQTKFGSSQQLTDCIASKEGISINQKLADTMTEEEDLFRSHLLYLPNDEFNIWMFAMIGIGCLFVVFVAVSFYLMCHNSTSTTQENGTQVMNPNKP